MSPSVIVVGEPLAELRLRTDGALDVSYSGDALNVAVQLARNGVSVDLATAVGEDSFSRGLLERLEREAIGADLIRSRPTGALGVYLVELDGTERRFTYWRANSPARELVDLLGPESLALAVGTVDAVFVSGITMAVLDDPQRDALLEVLCTTESLVVFDPNVRQALWDSPDTTRRWTRAVFAAADVVLASSEDLDALGEPPEELASSVPELVVTDGEAPTRWWDGDGSSGRVEVPTMATTVVDTTGAGDAFDAAYLAHRLRGFGLPESVVAAHAVAAEAVAHRGGLLWPE